MGQLGPKGSRLGPLWLFFGLGRLLKGSQKSLWALKDMLGSLEGLNEVTVASGTVQLEQKRPNRRIAYLLYYLFD